MDYDLKVIEFDIESDLEDALRKLELTNMGDFYAIIAGYDNDPRELGDIPEVVALCQRMVEAGLLPFFTESAFLDLNTSKPASHPGNLPPGFGAFEVWSLAQGRLTGGKLVFNEDHIKEFRGVHYG
jgi:hypothetical protein